ncbi:receptor-type tyrosine-protein phosphatase mu-like [Oppia nitens]|uniref:receptor-type tyrosine-protein phosphatase mu-like n=1 Tax=Oppia nitens TaxID=1686743 RepID=UPI0023D9FCD2|nr:receptor-type tyrosine-protein phosphatase mu-like [Oppia nitens]
MIKFLIFLILIFVCFCYSQPNYETNENPNNPNADCVRNNNKFTVIAVKNGVTRVQTAIDSCLSDQKSDNLYVMAIKLVNKDDEKISEQVIRDLFNEKKWSPGSKHQQIISDDKHMVYVNCMKNNHIIDFNGLDTAFKYKFGIFDKTLQQMFINSDSVSVTPKTDGNLEIILIAILAILLLITFVLLAVLLYINYAGESRLHNVFLLWTKSDRRKLLRRDKDNAYDQSYRCSTLSFGSFHEQEFEIKTHPLDLSDLSDTIPLMIENNVLKQEFMSVSRGQLMRWDYGKQVQHRSKNRYGNLLPYDHSRVVLDIINNDSNTDYINANYVDGCKVNNRYVATQGPLPNTISDFWRMIWQLDTHQIVMLTSLDEGGKNKCDKYWPDHNSANYGDIKVNLTKTEMFADYIIRWFCAEKEGVEREILQYHFISWPDHNVPMYACSLISFVRKMRSSVHYKPNQPIVVHCSAGVGRTGTYILIDAMLEAAQHDKQIDILKQLCVMRQQRINLIEKLGQYIFAHQSLLEALSHEPTSIACNDFQNYFTKLIHYDSNSKTLPIMKQFQILNKLSPQMLNPDVCQSARSHQHLNRNQNIIPPDFSRVILPGNDDYINAVYINGYKRRDAYIATQVPLEVSRSHFWQMIVSTASKTIVLLNDIKSDQIYWPTVENKQLDFTDNNISVQLVSEEPHNNVIIRVFHLPQSDLTVKQFHLKGWPVMANRPPTPQTIIDLMEMTDQWNLQFNSNSIVVQCFDGNQASGIFCAMSFECDRIKEEQEIDVFLAVQTVRTTRPQFITDLDQYKFLHQIAISYLQYFDTYANFK